MGLILAIAALGLILGSAFYFTLFEKKNQKNLAKFPGPPQLPVIGSVHKLPLYGAPFQFKLWTDQYGPIVEAKLFRQRIMVISSAKIVKDLFVNNGKVFSGRPPMPAIQDSQSHNRAAEYLPLMTYNEDHHRHKKFGNILMVNAQAKNNFNIPVLEARRAMFHLADKGRRGASISWVRDTEEMASRVISKLCFGSTAKTDILYKLTFELLVLVSPTGLLPNLIPPVSKLPFWISPWKWVELYRNRNMQNWFKELLDETRKQAESGDAPKSFMLEHVKAIANPSTKSKTYPDDADAAKAIGMIAAAATFTVGGPLLNIIRALICFPEWQTKLQEEMDAVVPYPNMPTLEDMKRLPLLRAFIRETVRWRQAIPTGIPHQNQQVYEYEGVVIDKDTTIFASEYGINRDPEVYDNPYDFDPMRWIDPNSRNYDGVTEEKPTILGTPMFGWGRRWCMGAQLATDEIYAYAASVVWTFNLTTPEIEKLDERLIAPEKRGGFQWPRNWMTSFIIMKPEDFKVEFKPRSQERADVLQQYNVAEFEI